LEFAHRLSRRRERGVCPVSRRQWGIDTLLYDLLTDQETPHLFEEPGTLDEAARLAAEWCARHLAASDIGSRTTGGRTS